MGPSLDLEQNNFFNQQEVPSDPASNKLREFITSTDGYNIGQKYIDSERAGMNLLMVKPLKN